MLWSLPSMTRVRSSVPSGVILKKQKHKRCRIWQKVSLLQHKEINDIFVNSFPNSYLLHIIPLKQMIFLHQPTREYLLSLSNGQASQHNSFRVTIISSESWRSVSRKELRMNVIEQKKNAAASTSTLVLVITAAYEISKNWS